MPLEGPERRRRPGANYYYIFSDETILARPTPSPPLPPAQLAAYEKCGKNAETVSYRALLASGSHWVPFQPGQPVLHLNGAVTSHGLDLAAYGQNRSYKLGLEIKNSREWIYPESWPVWKVIGACI